MLWIWVGFIPYELWTVTSTHDTKLKMQLLAYVAKFLEPCQQTDDDEQDGLRFEIDHISCTQEWYNSTKNYDPDWKIYKSTVHNPAEFSELYSEYGLYTQEMKEKLDTILEKYQMRPRCGT